jgi:hypothetical protein
METASDADYPHNLTVKEYSNKITILIWKMSHYIKAKQLISVKTEEIKWTKIQIALQFVLL